jgi:hypothetical protein
MTTSDFKRAFLTLIILLGTLQVAYSAAFELDFTAIDNSAARVTGTSVDVSFQTSNITSITIAGTGLFTVELNHANYPCAFLKLDIGKKGFINSVKWTDGDSSQTSGQFVTLPTLYYTLQNGGKRLVLTGIAASFDFTGIDLSGFEFPQAGVPTPDANGVYPYQLFPGDYRLVLGNDEPGAGLAVLEMELLESSQSWDSTILWRPFLGPESPALSIVLPGENYQIDRADLEFLGIDMVIVLTADNTFLSLVQAGTGISNNDSLRLFPGTYHLQAGLPDSLCATYSMILDAATKVFADTVWMTDGDSSMYGNGIPLPTGIVYGQGSKLNIKGLDIYVNLERPDLTLAMRNVTTGAGQNGWQMLKLLPGDYPIYPGNMPGKMVAEVRPEGNWNSRLYFLPPGEKATLENLLHGRCFSRNADSLDIHGMQVTFEVTALPDSLDFEVDNLQAGTGEIPDSAVFRLLPGGYLMKVVTASNGNVFMDVAFSFDNQKGGLSSRIDWKDLTGNATNGNFEQYPPEDALARHGSLIVFYVPGGPKTKIEQDYAVPERKPSGAWYQLTDAKLWFKYEGEYDPGQLEANVLNWKREVVLSPSVLALQKEYGDNRLMINCATLGVGHYTLELTNEKNETFYVRFEKN